LIAIFDADFLPPKDFLQKTISYFADGHIGMVQTKWGHINKNSSLLTSLQAIALDGHFSIEQTGRNSAVILSTSMVQVASGERNVL
jgi:cellulose synthase/poly-beta-1,6-N-acetylglucosamine synthase-like glycosyltransferase